MKRHLLVFISGLLLVAVAVAWLLLSGMTSRLEFVAGLFIAGLVISLIGLNGCFAGLELTEFIPMSVR